MEKRGYLCYSCKEYVKEPHEHYLRMCKKCGDFNMDMRKRKADLNGYIALVTGARIKIGYQTVLKLLRYGATVIATTRFPLDAAERYSKEADFENWKDRLFLCRLDLLRVDKLDLFINYVMKSFGYIDIIINNAAQTVREHESIYHELIEKENMLLQNHKLDLDNFWDVERTIYSNDLSLIKHIPLHKDDEIKNSWKMEIEDIGIKEFLEVQLINVTAPFILNSRLKLFFVNSPNKNRFIINVSSIEGQFSQKKKGGHHVHTNMAKASLNMMTRTIAREYSRERIFIYSVDPGWVSNRFSDGVGLNEEEFQPPLEYEDAAVRLIYPILEWKDSDRPEAGILLKNYKKVEW